MTQARRNLISLTDTPYYHVLARCVRRAYLCGEDRSSGQNYKHRRQWIVDKLKELSYRVRFQLSPHKSLN